MEKKKYETPSSTITRSMPEIWEETGNVYESVRIIAKRANQIAAETKRDIQEKLQEVIAYQETLEDPTDCREQIEISKHYEQQPKPTLVATTEFLNGDLYHRAPMGVVNQKD